MMTPKRIQRKRIKGWKMPPNTVYVGRPTKWGNRYQIRKMKDNSFGVFRTGLHYGLYGLQIGYHKNYSTAVETALMFFRQDLTLKLELEIKKELRGKNLACFCKEGEPCHADVLLKIANE